MTIQTRGTSPGSHITYVLHSIVLLALKHCLLVVVEHRSGTYGCPALVHANGLLGTPSAGLIHPFNLRREAQQRTLAQRLDLIACHGDLWMIWGAVLAGAAGDHQMKLARQLPAALAAQLPTPDDDARGYRHLEEGYTALDVAPWAEQRVCIHTGSSNLYAKVAFSKGDVLSEFGSRSTLTEANYLTVQVGDKHHILLAPTFLQYINHSCDPNCAFNTTTFQLEALRDIRPGDELTFFYPSTEWEMASPFQCRCGTPSCIGNIAGASQLSPSQLAQHSLSEYIRQKLEVTQKQQH